MIPHQLIFIKNNRGLSFINSAPFHPFPQSQNDGAAHVITKNLPVLYQGVGVSAGVVGGPLKILNSVRDLTNVSQGDIVIIPEANSLYTPILENCAGIVALQGGASSHLSILARESVIPMIIATATQAMRWQHKSLTIDGGLGVIYAGISSVLSQTPSKLTANSLPVQTVTKRFYDASIQKISETTIPSDSSGISLNGNSFIQTNNNQALFNPPSTLVTNTLTSLLPSKPCIYQISDPFNVVDQSRQVDSVTNPLLGNRGVYAYLQQSSVIKSEVDWLKQFKQAHTQALYLIFPLTRTVDELIRFKRLLSASGLSRSPKLKLIASLDTPANVQNLEDVNRIGFDGISLNLNHLIPLWLGFDPYDIHFHDSLYQFRPSIATIIKTCLESAHDYKFFSHIRGFALTTNTEYLDLAVDVGVTAVTIPPSEWGHAAATIQFKEERRILP
jgi:pyruvate,water dikinase